MLVFSTVVSAFSSLLVRDDIQGYTRWFIYDRDYLCVKKSQFVLVIFCAQICVCLYFLPVGWIG
jgi:hypothetical protein